MHPAIQAIEQYYTTINRGEWSEIAETFNLPAVFLVGTRKTLLDETDAVTTLYQGLGDKFAQEGAVRLSWDRGSSVVFQIHDDLAVVKTVVTREAADRAPIRTWNCSYTLRLVGKDWLFVLMTSDDTGDAKTGLTRAST